MLEALEPTRTEELEWTVTQARIDVAYAIDQLKRFGPDRAIDALERALANLASACPDQ